MNLQLLWIWQTHVGKGMYFRFYWKTVFHQKEFPEYNIILLAILSVLIVENVVVLYNPNTIIFGITWYVYLTLTLAGIHSLIFTVLISLTVTYLYIHISIFEKIKQVAYLNAVIVRCAVNYGHIYLNICLWINKGNSSHMLVTLFLSKIPVL